jgi:SnoaL-like domain
VTDEDRRALRELRDRSDIRDVVLRYARGVDRRDLELVAACFTPDAAYQGTLSSTSIGDALRSLARSLERYESTFHFLGNQLVELRGDEADCETYAVAYHRARAGTGGGDLTVAVRYLDQLVRVGSAWRIRGRRAETVWSQRGLVPPG